MHLYLAPLGNNSPAQLVPGTCGPLQATRANQVAGTTSPVPWLTQPTDPSNPTVPEEICCRTLRQPAKVCVPLVFSLSVRRGRIRPIEPWIHCDSFSNRDSFLPFQVPRTTPSLFPRVSHFDPGQASDRQGL